MLHLAHSWRQHADPKYWPQAINYVTWVFNNLPNMDSGISPNKLWSNMRNCDDVFKQGHVFGCPVYVLDATLQDRKKIPKWSPCARLGLFLGFSDVHSSQVPLVLNVETKKISPQIHVIFDDTFQTVHLLPSNKPIHEQLKNLEGNVSRKWITTTTASRCYSCFQNDQRLQQDALPPLSCKCSYDQVDNNIPVPYDT